MIEPKNRVAFLEKHNLYQKKDAVMKQVHGSHIIRIDGDYSPQEADGMITNRDDIALFVLVADCIPVLLYDKIQNVIGVVHAGRQGVFKNILANMVKEFVDGYQSKPEDIQVIFGPHALKCCYEVGRDTNEHIDFVRNSYGEDYIFENNIDLAGIAVKQLIEAGLLKENIQRSSTCTMCNGNNEYYSYRNGNNGNKERFAGIITLT